MPLPSSIADKPAPLAMLKTISELLVPRASLPTRVDLSAVLVLAIGKISVEDTAKGQGKTAKGGKGGGKLQKGKGKGSQAASITTTANTKKQQVPLYIIEPETGNVMLVTYQSESISITDLQSATVNIKSAKPIIDKTVGLQLMMDKFSGITVRLNTHDGKQEYLGDLANMPLSTFSEVTSMPAGGFVNMLLYLEVIEEKLTNNQEPFLHLSVMDTLNQRESLQLYNYAMEEFTQGDTLLALGLSLRYGRSYQDGDWRVDMTWCQAKYTAYRSAVVKVGIQRGINHCKSV